MNLTLSVYRLLTSALHPFLGFWLGHRTRSGKEDYGRTHERFAKKLPSRKPGPLVWLHGASVGESQLLLELGKRLAAERPDLMLLFTSQTQTSAQVMGPLISDNAFHAMAPIDTPKIAKRFVQHWRPDLVVFGEGEIWPNLITAAEKSGSRRALVNARMTESSANGWYRWRGLFRHLVGRFDVVLAADDDTARRLSKLLGRIVETSGNLKSSMPPPGASDVELRRLQEGFVAGRRCLLAASTHPTEEVTFLDATEEDPDAALIIAPRHPERGDDLEYMLKSQRISYARRSKGHQATPRTRVLLADTIGEMGIWFRLADAVYLGGGHAPGIGGHNPLEPLRLGKPTVSGPDVFNFTSMMEDLSARGLLKIAPDRATLADALLSPQSLPAGAVADMLASADAPMAITLAALLPLLPPPDQRS